MNEDPEVLTVTGLVRWRDVVWSKARTRKWHFCELCKGTINPGTYACRPLGETRNSLRGSVIRYMRICLPCSGLSLEEE